MSGQPQARKAALRTEVRARMAELSPETRRRASAALCERLRASSIWRASNSILFFAPLPDEPDVWPLLAVALGEGKTVGLPRYDAASANYEARQVLDPVRDVEIGRFQVREPTSDCALLELDSFHLILVPGVAFDSQGGRLGRGRGYYDRLLAALRGVKCGIAFDDQIVAEVPTESQDIKVDTVLTPGRWVRPGD